MKQSTSKEKNITSTGNNFLQKDNKALLSHSNDSISQQNNDSQANFLTNADMRVMNLLNDLLGELSDDQGNNIIQDKTHMKTLSKLKLKKIQNDEIEVHSNSKSNTHSHDNNNNFATIITTHPNNNNPNIKSSSKHLAIIEEFDASTENLIKKINGRKQSLMELTDKTLNVNNKNSQTAKSTSLQKTHCLFKKDISQEMSSTTQTFIRHHYSKRPQITHQIEEEGEITEKKKSQTLIGKPNFSLLKSPLGSKQLSNDSRNDFYKKNNSSKTMPHRNSNSNNINKATNHNHNHYDNNKKESSVVSNKSKIYDSLSITNQNEIKSIQSKLKQTIVGEIVQGFNLNEIERKTFLNDKEDEEEEINNNNINRYRVLTRKGFIYDSLDDDEDREDNTTEGKYYIPPNLVVLYIHDMILFFQSIYFIVYLPLFFAKQHNMDFKDNQFEYIMEIISEVTYLLDILLHFFVAYYNFEELLITNLKLIIYHYLSTWFALDIIVSIPYIIFPLLMNNNNALTPLYSDYSNKNPLCLLALLHIGKIFKTTCANKFTFTIKNWLMDFTFYQQWNKAFISICCLILSLHCLTCIFIFIGQVSYPNWIFSQSLESSSFAILYINSLYYIITTVFTIGYGDITVKNNSERVFNLILLLVGIAMYSWTLSSISTYIQTKDVKTLEFRDKLAILNEIRFKYSKMPPDLYERITRYLRYKLLNEKKDKNVILDFLPIALRNNLVSEMYKDIIEGFAFFKTFKNTDFIVRVIMAFRPILGVKNDILVKKGDYIEEIIFVKRGNLTLEIPLFLLSIKDNEDEASIHQNKSIPKSLFNFSQMINSIESRHDLMPFDLNHNNNNQTHINQNEENLYDELNQEEVQHAKILEIRRNEHFGDILMFLNKRSPLRVKVKSKKAELFFLYKTEAVEISMSYPKIWRKIIKKSLFNMEQIDRLITKAKNIFLDAISKEKQSFMTLKTKLSMKKTLNKRDSISQQFTQRDNSLLENRSIQALSDDFPIKKANSLLSNSEPVTNNSKNCMILSPVSEKKNTDKRIINNTIVEHEVETSKINHSNCNYSCSCNCSCSSNSDRTIKMDIKNKTVYQTYSNSSKGHSLVLQTDELSGSTNAKPCLSTPFKTSDINLEIYPNEEFILLTNSNSITFNQVSNYINDIRCNSLPQNVSNFNDNDNDNDNDTLTSIMPLPPLNRINHPHLDSHRKHSLKNLQLSNESNIMYASIYKNINSLFDYNSIQSSQFVDSLFLSITAIESPSQPKKQCMGSSLQNIIVHQKKEDQEKLGRNSVKINTNTNQIIYSSSQEYGFNKQLNKSIVSDNHNNSPIIKGTKALYGSNEKDINPPIKTGINHNKSKDKNYIKEISMKQLDKLNNNKKPDLLNLISQNIEKNSQNMNNPVLFYSELFKRVMSQENKGQENSNIVNEQQLLYNRLLDTEKLIYTLLLSDSD